MSHESNFENPLTIIGPWRLTTLVALCDEAKWSGPIALIGICAGQVHRKGGCQDLDSLFLPRLAIVEYYLAFASVGREVEILLGLVLLEERGKEDRPSDQAWYWSQRMNPHGASEVPEGWDVCHSGYLEKRVRTNCCLIQALSKMKDAGRASF
jgi:hypothetical protein